MIPAESNAAAVGLMRSPDRESGGVPLAVPAWRVRAVIPCFNRRRDAELLLADLAMLDLGGRAQLSIVLVDNASEPPLGGLAEPDGLSIEHLRLEANTGGSGGFNAGMARVLSRGVRGDQAELIWLLDSDARVEPGTLLPLIEALESDPSLGAAGSAIVDPATGKIFEVGGRVNPVHGSFEAVSEEARGPEPVRVPYVAACSALVRRTVVERTGLIPDTFLNGDDVQWFLQITRRTGMGVAAVPRSRAIHPTFDKFQTWARYYIARNGLGPIDAAGLGRGVRLVRALKEVCRSTLQTMMGREDLAELHLSGLSDALAGRLTGARTEMMRPPLCRPMRPLAGLGKDLADRLGPRAATVTMSVHPDLGPPGLETVVAEQLTRAGLKTRPGEPARGRPGLVRWLAMLGRVVAGPRTDVAVVPARGRPATWLAGRLSVQVTTGGYAIQDYRSLNGLRFVCAAIGRGIRGTLLALRIAARPRGFFAAPPPSVAAHAERLSVTVVVLSYNRWPALERTLRRLQSDPGLAGAGVIVADNASTDGTPDRVRAAFPGVRVIALTENLGVAAFNRAVRQSDADAVLILDDDASPEPGAVAGAMDLLAHRADLGAVALHPRHPATKASEWRFGENSPARDDWPVMGCGNLVRRTAWERVGGYEESFFLYRNDTDLAMKLLEAGFGVHFNPAWVVWHDSPAAAAKSARWLEMATRNWVWVCRRHGRGLSVALGAVLGGLWANRLAGLSAPRQWNVLRGWARGWTQRPAALPVGLAKDGRALSTLLRMRLTPN